jgi:hypothetical protein
VGNSFQLRTIRVIEMIMDQNNEQTHYVINFKTIFIFIKTLCSVHNDILLKRFFSGIFMRSDGPVHSNVLTRFKEKREP